MADSDWKKRVGIPINYNSSSGSGDDEVDEEDDQDHSVEYRVKSNLGGLDITNDSNVDLRRQSDELALKFEEYGSTPPRTRMKNKIRDWDRRQKNDLKVGGRGASRLARSRTNRRNTVDCAILNELFIDDDSKRTDKRAQQLLRESERDQKISTMVPLATVPSMADLNNKIAYEERSESMPMVRNSRNLLSIVPKLIECSNRYMSVTSRPVGCRTSAPSTAFSSIDNQTCQFDRSKMQTRRDFHETFANLIKLGSTCEKQESKISHEDYTWQTELKDLIWLELQAWHADRSLDQQDKYLYTARQGVPDLLEQILNYKFLPRYGRELSITSDDSGNASDGSPQNWENVHYSSRNLTAQNCVECFSLYCKLCQRQQSVALREVEELLCRLETAESLYPSSQVMGTCHPIYKCELFVGRVKAMCLWYNITKHQRLKLALIGKFFKKLQGRDFKWPMPSTSQHPADSSSSSTADYDDSGRDSLESSISVKSKKSPTKVKFIDDVSGDVTSSQDSVSSTEGKEYDDDNDKFRSFINEDDTPVTKKPYRKYIEHILKSRGLGRSLSFLHRLYTVVLRKTQISLEKPGTEDVDFDMEMFEESPVFANSTFMPPIDKEQEEELRRYGGWSPEAQSLGLPSYAPTFVFLSVIPLEIMHEYLKMRIESRPPTPNPLSLEQLIKELREGLILSMTHRERYNKHIHTALYDRSAQMEKYMQILDDFDATVREVVAIYFDYVEQWVLDAAPETHRKSAINKEWTFTKLISPMIAGNHAFAAKKFCSIVGFLLQRTGNRLINRATMLKGKIDETPIVIVDDDKRWQILTICREIQGLFTVERDNSLKILNFAKALCRDLESPDFHRDHDAIDGKSTICQEVKDAVMELQIEVLSVRHKLTKIIEHVQQRCDIKNLGDIDEIDRIAITTRTREILHQGFKFGFDYHKELVRLFENKIIVQKDKVCEFNLSLGIIHFAKMWMVFVTEKCERGRGVRPRWAAQGLEFLISACDPTNTKHLTESEFDDLKSKMDACISHVVGIVSEPEKIRKRSSPRTRKISPATSRALTPTRTSISPRLLGNEDPQQRLQLLQQMSVKEETNNGYGSGGGNLSPSSTPTTPQFLRKTVSVENDTTDNHHNLSIKVPKMLNNNNGNGNNNFTPVLRQIRIRDAVNHLDLELDKQLQERNLIGQVKTLKSSDKHHIGARSVCFRWHRGIKIGQGRFGKVYTAVNNSTGELMAMKEITIQPNETRAIKKVAEELKIFEGISHRFLVKYYGVEIHREELLIFMELCAEGTLESLVEMSGGLYEGLNRRYTAQLLSAVTELHRHGVVHRDIKTANIFLTNGGNCLKLGDFGSAVKIQAHTTLPGELVGYVGTQSYMAPEVFTKTNSDGHGRAADVWSVGCCVIEMASGKRPWSQFDSNFQIMFKVGMGETPEAPECLSEEGHEFLSHCLEHDPKLRWTTVELLQHHFCKVDVESDCDCNTIHNIKSPRSSKTSMTSTKK